MKTNKIKDKIIFSRLKRKDKEAFIRAYDFYLDSIYRFIFFRVSSKEEAEDLTSTTFLKTWDYIQNNNLSEFKTLKSLLYKVARNLVIDYYRKKSNKNEISLDESQADQKTIDERQDILRQAEITSDFEFIQEKIFALKDEYREIIILRYVNELSIKEIAKILDKSNGNVRVLLFRAMKALRSLVDNHKT